MYRILIVEDDRDIAQAVREQAQAWNFDARCVQDFRNVMAEFARFDPHLVLLDVSLPFFNGYHWCSEIRKTSQVPIIFISSASDSMNIVMAMNMGADDFIAKPFDLNVLIAKVQALMRRSYDYALGPGAGASRRDSEHRRRQSVLPGAADRAEQERVPHPAHADAQQGQGGQPGEADGTAVEHGLLRG